MAHLIYKAPLVNEKARERYIQTRRDLDTAKNRGDIDSNSYKLAKKNLAISVSSSVSSPSSPDLRLQSTGSAGSASDVIGGYFDQVVIEAALQRTRSSGSSSGSTGGRTDRSTSFSFSTPSGLGLSKSRTSSTQADSISPKSTRRGTIFDRNNVSRLVFKPNAQSEVERTQLKEEAKSRAQLKRLIRAYEISQHDAAPQYITTGGAEDERIPTPTPAADAEYDPRVGAHADAFYSTRPLPPIAATGSAAAPRTRNFNFFRWNSRPQPTVAHIAVTRLEATPRSSLEGAGPRRPAASTPAASLYSTAPSSLRQAAPSFSTVSTAEGGILGRQTSNDTLRSCDRASGGQQPPASEPARPRTLADHILGGPAEPRGVLAAEGRPSRDSSREVWRPQTGGSSIKAPRRRHSFSSDRSFSQASRRSVDSHGSRRAPRLVEAQPNHQIPRREMFIFPFSRGRRAADSASLKRPSSALANISVSDDYVLVEPENQDPPSPTAPGILTDCGGSTPPSSILLDAFVSLLEEYSLAPRLFSFPRSDNSIRPGTQSTTSKAATASSTRSVALLGTSSDEDAFHSDDSITSSIPPTEFQLAYVQYRHGLESIVWFLSAWKWLSCGRLLFSPSHHLLSMACPDDDYYTPETFAGDMTVLDLDGPATGGWSWHMAYDYPSAIIYNVTTSPEYLHSHGTTHMQPINHRLVLTESLTSLKPLESNFFDVITARTLPRTLRREDWIPLFRECHRVLKPDGYLELTIVNPVLTNMGPVTKAWIQENILAPIRSGVDGDYDVLPSESVLYNLGEAGLSDIYRCQVWMPAGSIGDEFSSVTSRVGRYFYDELFAKWARGGGGGEMDGKDRGIAVHEELEVWKIAEVQRECVALNTVFQWLRCHARKGPVGGVGDAI
ncbi:hypothetical protein DFH27DRAFT_520372 [Peziza echinospora]|nr:hypothetical protein DFH27DRAFT_520372 [Peziza echinospora]